MTSSSSSPLRARSSLWSLLPQPSSIVDLTIPIPGSTLSSSSARPSSPTSSRRPGLTAARAARAGSASPEVAKSRWRTREFCFYYAVFILVLPRMVGSVVRLSRGEFLDCSWATRLSGRVRGWAGLGGGAVADRGEEERIDVVPLLGAQSKAERARQGRELLGALGTKGSGVISHRGLALGLCSYSRGRAGVLRLRRSTVSLPSRVRS